MLLRDRTWPEFAQTTSCLKTGDSAAAHAPTPESRESESSTLAASPCRLLPAPSFFFRAWSLRHRRQNSILLELRARSAIHTTPSNFATIWTVA